MQRAEPQPANLMRKGGWGKDTGSSEHRSYSCTRRAGEGRLRGSSKGRWGGRAELGQAIKGLCSVQGTTLEMDLPLPFHCCKRECATGAKGQIPERAV